MKENIKDIFQNVNDWLKFAEAKHAGLIVLNSGIVFGLLAVFKDYKSHIHWSLILITLILIGLSIMLTLISLFPVINNNVKSNKSQINPNLYFFGSLSLLNETDLKNELSQRDPTYTFDKFDEDLINQIIVNSKIASRKYRLFKYGIITTTIGLSIPIINILIRLIWH